MDALPLQSLLITQICLLLLNALCAAISWRLASAAIRHRKRLGQCETDLLTHESELSRLKDMVSRLSKRQSLADYKASQQEQEEEQTDMFRRDRNAGPPGKNATKDQLREYWLKGRSHQEIANLAKGQR